LKRIIGVLAFIALALGLASAPAQAATINGCDENNVCLYDWINANYASGFWQRPIATMRTNSDGGVTGCTNLSNHQWHDLDGSPNGTASSGLINRSDQGAQSYRVDYYDYLSCSPSGPSFSIIAGVGELVINNNFNSLSTCDLGQCSYAWENRVSSIKVTYWP
jgi:hypothetical protein